MEATKEAKVYQKEVEFLRFLLGSKVDLSKIMKESRERDSKLDRRKPWEVSNNE